MHTFVPCPQSFCLLKPITHVCSQGHLKMSWVLPLPVPMPCPDSWNTSPRSAFSMPLYLEFGAGGWTRHMECWELGPWIAKLHFHIHTSFKWFPSSLPRFAEELGMREKQHHWVWGCLFACFVLLQDGSHYVAQAGPKFLGSTDSTCSVSWEVGITGMCHHTQLTNISFSAVTQVQKESQQTL
jgi:hypothetical protein